jgi:hypothetical protein
MALDRPPLLLVSGAGGVWRLGDGVEASREEQGRGNDGRRPWLGARARERERALLGGGG